MAKPEDTLDETNINKKEAKEIGVENESGGEVLAVETEKTREETDMVTSGESMTENRIAALEAESDPKASEFRGEAETIQNDRRSAESTRDMDLDRLEETNETGQEAESMDEATIKKLLTTLDSAKLDAPEKKRVLDKLIASYEKLYGSANEDERTAIFKENPTLREIVGLINKIDNDIKQAGPGNEHDNEPDTEDVTDETNESPESGADPIKEKIKNNEMLSVEEEKILFDKCEKIILKQRNGEDISEEEVAMVMMYQEAVGKGLTAKGAEVNESVDKDVEEINAFNEKSKEEKDKDINERLEKIKSSGIELSDKAEDAEEHIKELEKQLKDRYDEFTKMEEDIEKIRNTEGVDQEGARTLKNTISSLKNIYTDKLHIEYYEYWIKYLKGGVESLHDSHAKHNISMNQLETLGGDLESDLASIEKGESEVLAKWAQFIKDHPKTGLALITAALAAGILLSPYLVKFLGAPEIAKLGTGALAPLMKPTIALGAKAVGSLASISGSVGLAGIFLLLTNSEKIDDAMESIWGKKIPNWASWGLKKKGQK
ncbi:MAG: hypothetical protein WC788_03640 [Candidatus Paceibacterota bacterium]|jgi:hypothetical protein